MSDAEMGGSQPVLMLTMQQAADLCQVSVDRVREWTFLPDFPVMRTAHMVRIHARLFDEWLMKHSHDHAAGRDEEQAA